METPAAPVHCLVPARMGSGRFPGKPLALLHGIPMIVRTLRRAQAASCFKSIACATDHPDIARVAEEAGFTAVLTPPCATGSDRVAWAAEALDLDLVVNLQGDEPIASLSMLRAVALALAEEPSSWITACAPLLPEDLDRESVVKVWVEAGYARDFSRKITINSGSWFTHRGIYAYSREARKEFAGLPPTAAEQERSLEQMRVLGQRPIRVVFDAEPSASVDLPSDITLVESLIKEMRL